jgi:hypothetical protein
VSDSWFCAEGEKPVGPISLEELTRLLSKTKDWRKKLVWNANFTEWREAGSIPEINIVEPPPVPKIVEPPPVPKIVEPPPVPKILKPPPLQTKWWRGVLGMLAIIVVGITSRELVTEYMNNRPLPVQEVEKVLTQIENEAQLPRTVDGSITWVGVKHTGVKELTYFYSVDTQNYHFSPDFADTLRKTVVPTACAQTQMKELLRDGVTLWYRYRDHTGKEIGRFGLNQNDCH